MTSEPLGDADRGDTLRASKEELLDEIVGSGASHALTVRGACLVLALAVAVGVAFAVAVPEPFDLSVYRFGASSVTHGDSLYVAVDPHTGRLFTYPPFAAILFGPIAWIPAGLAAAVWTTAGVLALALTIVLVLREHLRTLSLALLVMVVLLGLATYPVRETPYFGQVNLLLMAAICADLLLARGRWTRCQS